MNSLLWFLMAVLIVTPGAMYIVYFYRRLGTRRELLKQTLLSLRLEDLYVQTRHGERYEAWKSLKPEECVKAFTEYFDRDFRVGSSHKDYLWPVALFTILSGIAWTLTLSRVVGASSLLPDSFAYGFVGAWCASLLTIFDEFRKFNLDPAIFYSITYRVLFSSTAAFVVVPEKSAAVAAFGLGLFPIETTWRLITDKAAKLLGIDPPEPHVGTALAVIQGLEDKPNRQKLLDNGISTVQALATYDPLLLFLLTTFPLRAVVDMIDKAILYLYIGDATVELRKRGINGVIELVGLARLAEQKPAYSGSGVASLSPFYRDIDIPALIADIGKVIGQSPEQLKAFIYNLDCDPQVQFIYNIWGKYLQTEAKADAGIVTMVVQPSVKPTAAPPASTEKP